MEGAMLENGAISEQLEPGKAASLPIAECYTISQGKKKNDSRSLISCLQSQFCKSDNFEKQQTENSFFEKQWFLEYSLVDTITISL